MNSTTKIIAGVAVLALLFAGIGYAVQYSGTVTNTGNSGTANYLTVDIEGADASKYEGFLTGIYLLDTQNVAGTYSYVAVKDSTGAAQTATIGLTYDAEEFAIVEDDATYDGFKIGEITLSIDMENAVDEDTATLTVLKVNDDASTPAPGADYHAEDGISLVYTYTVGTGTETVLTAAGVADLDGIEDITIKAYLVTLSQMDTKPTATFTIADDTIFKFVATAGGA